MRLERLSHEALRHLYSAEMKDTFPAGELKPFFAMARLLRKGCYHPFAAVENSVPVGYVLLWTDEASGIALIDYFWVNAARRGGGAGSRILTLLPEQYAGYRGLLAEVEHPDGVPASLRPDALRRLDFYRRAGFETLDYDCALFGVQYRVLWHSIAGANPEDMMQAHRALYLNRYLPALMRRYFQIPLAPGEEVYRPRW